MALISRQPWARGTGRGGSTLLGLAIAGGALEAVLVGWLRTFSLALHPGFYAVGQHALVWILGSGRAANLHFSLLLIGLVLPYAAALRLVRGLSGRAALIVAFAGSLVFGITMLLIFPVGSNDVFHNIADGRLLWLHGLNPLVTSPSAIPSDSLYRYVTSWRDLPSTYGPLWYLATWPAAVLAGTGRDANIVFFKAIPLLFQFISLVLLALIVNRINPRQVAAAVIYFGWSPLVLFEIAGNGHNDSLMLALLLLAFLLLLTRFWPFALTALACSVLVKYTPIIFVPLFLVWIVRRYGREAIKPAFLGVAIAALIGMLTFAPFWAGSSTFSHLVSDSNFQTNSPAGFLLIISYLIDRHASHVNGLILAIRISTALAFLVACVFILRRLAPTVSSLVEGAIEVSFLFLVLASGWFWPWYVTVPLGLGALVPRSRHAGLIMIFSLTAMAINQSEAWGGVWSQLLTPVLVFAPPIIYGLRHIGGPGLRHARPGNSGNEAIEIEPAPAGAVPSGHRRSGGSPSSDRAVLEQ